MKKLLLLIAVLAISFCFVELQVNGNFGNIRFAPGFSWWWNSVSPGGEQTGFAILKGDKRLFSFEEWNGGIFVNFNYDPMNPDHLESGIWLKQPPPYVPTVKEQEILDQFPVEIGPPPAPAPPEPPAPQREWRDGKEITRCTRTRLIKRLAT